MKSQFRSNIEYLTPTGGSFTLKFNHKIYLYWRVFNNYDLVIIQKLFLLAHRLGLKGISAARTQTALLRIEYNTFYCGAYCWKHNGTDIICRLWGLI